MSNREAVNPEQEVPTEPKAHHRKWVDTALQAGRSHADVLHMANTDPIPVGERPILMAYVQKLKDADEPSLLQ